MNEQQDNADGNSPEELDALRSSVEDWLGKSQDAVWSFFDAEDGSFYRDSKAVADDKISLTTTARCYMALAYSSRRLKKGPTTNGASLLKRLSNFLGDNHLKFKEPNGGEFYETIEGKDELLNNFELAHLADFSFLTKFAHRFSSETEEKGEAKGVKSDYPAKQIETNLPKMMKGLLRGEKKQQKERQKEGQAFFDDGEEGSSHFFVTLHALRSLNILEAEKKRSAGLLKNIENIVSDAERFCVRQCFYQNQGVYHLQDPARLAFAGAIYCLYGKNLERELVCAIVNTLSAMQGPNGTWETTHPIIRQNQSPWYIASHEIALCLTWLYFQPGVPDDARPVLLEMMQKFFECWLIPTYQDDVAVDKKESDGKKKEILLSGWYDDSKAGHNVVVGWATAIVCHFLANYMAVLDDHINRRVIVSLGLEATSERYLIDQTQAETNPRWNKKKAVWPDLPPFSWSSKEADAKDIGGKLAWNWTDPLTDAAISTNLAGKVIEPLLNSPDQRPQKDMVSGIFSGKPGTRKTSLVKVVSKIIEWPFVPVPASVIFDNGFDNMEARATEVFRRLNYLTGCVIFFDEFEEFFRQRPNKNAAKKTSKADDDSRNNIHDRTIAAFTTSAMLPRIQDLHDQRSCLFFLATNHVDQIDEAIMRPGRFDFDESINHPELSQFTNGGKSGYFSNITKIGLENLNLEISDATRSVKESSRVRLADIVDPVREVLSSTETKKLLKKIQKKIEPEKKTKTADSETDSRTDGGTQYIKFAFVEKALEAAADGDLKSKSARKTAAKKELVSVIDRLADSDGPPSLVKRNKK